LFDFLFKNDPIYVKMEKLEIIIKLVSEKNIDQVLLELKEYATEVDVDFVRKSVSAIGRCAVKLERAAERCIGVLLELIQTKVNYVVQESVIVIKDIFRRYPNRYESIIATLCDNLDTLDEPQAKASMIWIIGEYAERIDNADELLDAFLETFEEEDPAVQLQLLTATVKCFLKNPEETQDMVQRVLDLATEESDNPDLRDRGFIYWRLLSTDPEAAKLVVLGDKPVIEDDTFRLEPNLLNLLVGQIATLSSIYHKPPEAFVVRAKRGAMGVDDLGVGDDEEGEEEDYEDENDVNRGGGGDDLLDMGGLSVNETPANNYGSSGLEADMFGAPASPVNEPEARMSKVCAPEKSGGIELWAGFRQVNGAVKLELDVRNISSQVPVSTLAVQLNKNSFGLSPATQQIVCNPPIPVGGSGRHSVELVVNPTMLVQAPAGQPASPQIQVAIKNMTTGLVFYFAVNFAFEALFSPDGALERSTFIESWKSIDDKKELFGTVSDLPPASTDIDQVAAKFKSHHIFLIARRPVPNAEGQEVAYFSMRTTTGMVFMAELTFKNGVNAAKVCLKTEQIAYGVQAKVALETLLRS
jgi:AP-1 complex subunit beta-1